MVDVRPVRSVRVPWRKVGVALPAIALIASGTALAATSSQSDANGQLSAAKGGRIEVPAYPVHEQATFLQSAIGAPLPALALPVGMNALPAFGSIEGYTSPKVILDRSGIPAPALAAYRTAEQLLAGAAPACGLDWALVAAIGRVESNHARFGGNTLDSQGVARPGIIGIPLDGTNGTARISDTDQGAWDRDTSFDRAVGPMQFIPGSWRAIGRDADGDGVANPQDMNDAATSTGVYLCSGNSNVRTQDGLYNAIFRYNHSDSYVKTVINIAAAYRNGVTELPVSSLPAATTSSSGGDTNSGFAPAGGSDQAAGQPQSSPTQGDQPPAQAAPTTAPAPPKPGDPNPAPPVRSPSPAQAVPSVVASAASAAASAASSASSVMVTTLTPVPIPLAQIVGGATLPAPLPSPPADLKTVFRSTDPTTLNLCFVKGPVLPVSNIQQYSQVACPPNTN